MKYKRIQKEVSAKIDTPFFEKEWRLSEDLVSSFWLATHIRIVHDIKMTYIFKTHV